MNKLEQAIGASCMSNTELMDVVGLSAPTWYKRVSDPGSLTVGEFRSLSAAMDETSRGILELVLDEVDAATGPITPGEVEDMRIGDLFRMRRLAGEDIRGLVTGGAA